MLFAAISSLFFAAVALDGVTGAGLSVTADLDAHNVRIGDPLELTVRFSGSADFTSLHPPALSKSVDSSIWKIDDENVKTDTDSATRSLVYKVRPKKTGLLEFPSLEFRYEDVSARSDVSISTIPIPVSVRHGSQIALAEMDDARAALPNPDGILVDLAAGGWGSADGISEDGLFAWRKACASPSAAAFAKFDFPEARLNEAACETMEGNWAKALKIYRRLEWRIGQTPAIERGIVAAMARKTGDPNQELAMWRQTLRPVLRFALAGRVAAVAGLAAVLFLVMFLVRRSVRAIACAAVACAAFGAFAAGGGSGGGGIDPFEELERMRRQMDEQMQMMFNSPVFGGSGAMRTIVNGQRAEDAKITASVRPDRTGLVAGAGFNLILSLEMPKSCTVSELRFQPSWTEGYSVTGNGTTLTDGRSSDTNNVVRRVSIPVRYDAPFSGKVSFTVAGMKQIKLSMRGGRGFSSFSSNFRIESDPIWMTVAPLPDENRPAGFSGAVGRGFAIRVRADPRRVATNDVVTLDCTMKYSGYIPPGAVPGGIATGASEVSFRRYFVADGSPATDSIEFPYYDIDAQDYRFVRSDGIPLEYVAEEDDAPKTVVVNAEGEKDASSLVKLHFAPRETSPVIAEIAVPLEGNRPLAVTESLGSWRRVDDGRHAGWARKEEIE